MHERPDSEAADVFDFVDELLTDREKGRELPLAHYLARYPRCQDAIAREYLAFRTPQVDEPRSNVPGSDSLPRIGPYRILSEIGRGGQGTVFFAEDTRIARRVALKVLASRFDLVSEERRRRFRREAEVVARLEHPGICGIYDADIEAETPYIAMRYVEGRSLAQILARARTEKEETELGALPPRSALDVRRVLLFFERVARALHAAHEAGVVHRDVKPGTIMIGGDGKPVLLDFGLARDEQSEAATLTQSGDVLGTPAYMSPEQIAGGGAPLDRRTDVYSLAVALYEALTLVRPFEAPSRIALLRRILEEPVPDSRKKNPQLSEDVQVVLETGLERDRERRYATALELAEDLRRIREYEPIRARPAGVLLRFSRWTRRHPVLAVSIIGTILSLSSGLALALHLIAKRDQSLGYALGRHLAERCVALVSEDPALALAIGVEAADKEIHEGGSTKGANYLTRSALFQALDACWLERSLSGEPARLATGAALDPEGRKLALATDTGIARVFDLETGAVLVELPDQHSWIRRILFTPDGEEIVTAAADGKLRAFDSASGALRREMNTGEALTGADLSSDGTRLVAVGAAGRAFLFDARTGERTGVLDGGIRWAGFRPGSAQQILTRGSGGGATLWDARTASAIRDLGAGLGPAAACTFAPAGDRVAVGLSDGRVEVFSVPDGARAAPGLRFDAPAGFLAFSPDGARLLVATDRDQTGELALVDVATGASRLLPGHAGRRVVHGAFSPDGASIATASFDATVRLWSSASGAQLRVLGSAQGRPASVLWTPDGGRLVTLNNNWVANVWFTRNRPDLFELAGHTGPIVRARFSPDDRTALTASKDGTARLWSVVGREPGQLLHVLRHEGPVTDACFDRSGELVLTTSADQTARVWSARTGEPAAEPLVHPAAVVSGSFDARGSRILTVCADGGAYVSARSPASVPIRIASQIACASFDPEGANVACAGAADSVGVWDARTGEHVRDLPFVHDAGYAGGVLALAFARDGSELAAACEDAKVRFWDPRSGEEKRKALVVFPPRRLAYSLDGSKLLVTGRFGGGAAKVFALGGSRPPVPAEIAHAWSSSLAGGALSPDGSLVLTFATDGSAHVWEADSGRPVAHRGGGDAAILDGAFDGGRENPRVLVARDDGTVSVWPVDPLPAARARVPRALSRSERDRERRLALPLKYE